MRIALICPYDLGTPGGVQQQVLGLARALEAAGQEPWLVAPGLGDGAAGGVQAVDAGRSVPLPVNGSVAPMAPHPSALRRTRAVLAGGRFDVVHLHEPLAPSITWAALATRPAAPLVGTFHAAGDRTPYRWTAPLLRPLARRLEVRIAVSDVAADLARRHLGGDYEVLPNGIDAGPFAAPVGARAARPTVLFLGRHEPRKGLAVLLRACARLPDDVIVWVAGAGPATSTLRRRFAGERRVRWLGVLSEAEKLRRLQTAWVSCAPSLGGESCGVVLLEAMAAGTPVVASDLPGYRELGPAVKRVPPGDPAALARALREVLTGSRLAADLRAHGHRQVAGRSMTALADRYLDCYERARGGHGTSTLPVSAGRLDGAR